MPGRLVDDEQVVVLVDHRHRHRPRPGRRGFPRWAPVRSRSAGRRARAAPALPDRLAVDADLAALDQPLQVAARELRRQARRAPCRAARRAAPRRPRASRARAARPRRRLGIDDGLEGRYIIRAFPPGALSARCTRMSNSRPALAVSAISLAALGLVGCDIHAKDDIRASGRRSGSTQRPRTRPPPAATRRRSSSTSASKAAPPARCWRSRRSSSAPTCSGRPPRRRRRCRRSSASSSSIRPARRSTTRSTCTA